MKQIYIYSFLLVCCLLFANQANAQASTELVPVEPAIEELSIYPNPATGERVYIVTKKNDPKRIEVFNVLGKPVLSANLTGKELNISALESGIYILKIKEGNATATRKLVIR